MNRRIEGLRAWIWQRVSAVYLAGFILYFAIALCVGKIDSYEEWRSWIAAPVASTLMVIFFMMVLLHAWVGVRDVIMDYIHPLPLRIVLLILLGLGLLVCSIQVAHTLAMVWVG